MSKFRKLKAELRERLAGNDWRECLEGLRSAVSPQEYVGPLMALLPQAGLLSRRGALGMGIVVPALAERSMEEARVVMRRLMWHMNEESGNLGWGITESMAEIMSHSAALAREFGRVLFSYVLDSGREDNYIDYTPLLRSCFWSAGRLAQARPDMGIAAFGSFVGGLEHEDGLVRAQAALALLKLFEAAPDAAQNVEPAGRERAVKLLCELAGGKTECEDFDGEAIVYRSLDEVASRALSALG